MLQKLTMEVILYPPECNWILDQFRADKLFRGIRIVSLTKGHIYRAMELLEDIHDGLTEGTMELPEQIHKAVVDFFEAYRKEIIDSIHRANQCDLFEQEGEDTR